MYEPHYEEDDDFLFEEDKMWVDKFNQCLWVV